MCSIKQFNINKGINDLLGHEEWLHCDCYPVQILMKCWYVAFLCSLLCVVQVYFLGLCFALMKI